MIIYCLDFSYWKRKFIAKFLFQYRCKFKNKITNNKNASHISIAFWASNIIHSPNINFIEKEYQQSTRSSDKQLIVLHIEDGFIRSNGLGCNFYYPYSLVIDKAGIYYDPKNTCDLEKILQKLIQEYSNEEYLELFERACSLKELIIKNNITKYSIYYSNKANLTKHSQINNKSLESMIYEYNESFTNSTNNNNYNIEPKTIFIPAQIDDDASVILGGCGYSNITLLREVRKNHPSSFIIFKIHPDALSGNRVSEINIKEVKSLANYICSNEYTNIDCINLCNEIHTISSLVGFEALIRNKKVYCYGMPFYAGYGLTVDVSVSNNHPIALAAYARRKKINLFSDKNTNPKNMSPTEIGITNLIIGSLILYPTYFNWDKKIISTAEDVISTLLKNPHSKQNKFCYYFSKITKPFRKKYLNTNNLLEQYQIKENFYNNSNEGK